MLLPAVLDIHHHVVFASQMVKSMIKCRPFNPLTRRDFRCKLNFKDNNNPKNLTKTFYNDQPFIRQTITFRKGYKTSHGLENKIKYFSSLKNKGLVCLNGGYVPSYVLPMKDKAKIVLVENWQWYAKSKEDKGGAVRESGGGIGKLDAANEDGYFFKLNKSRLKKLQQMLKEKGELKSKQETPADKKIK